MGKDFYKMTISRMTVDKLGVKLYDKVAAVIAELIANSYDADAQNVTVTCPMDEGLATKTKDKIVDKGYMIEVKDDGIGMTPSEVNEFYLVVGKERRMDPKRGEKSKIFKRDVMGRKGVGKLAPFGVCQQIEIISSGGEKKTVGGKKGYITAHVILDKSKILKDIDAPYHPSPGSLDRTISPKRGTVIRLSSFDFRRVPSIDDFERALAQRFGLPSKNWRIKLVDALKTEDDPDRLRTVGTFNVEKMERTEIQFLRTGGPDGSDSQSDYRAFDPDGNKIDDLNAGFEYEGKFYPVTGWAAYSKKPYKDELMAGIRVYCRGKIATQTHIFNLKAGFTGEYDVRSYLIGELHANWLDTNEDLIRTDRQDILWDHDLGQAFEKWGQSVVKKIGVMTRQPKKQKAWETFEAVSGIHEKVNESFPSDEQKAIRENTIEMAKLIAQRTREEELQNPDYVNSLVDLSMLVGPHLTLDRNLREAAENVDDPLAVIINILKTARVAELAGFGKIAENRVRVIHKIKDLKDDSDTLESAFQDLISSAPWLINPEWVPITANQSFSTLKSAFQSYFRKKTNTELSLEDFSDPNKRTDFVLSNQDKMVQIIEIKRPGHSLLNPEMDRIDTYVQLMQEFLQLPGNTEFRSLFPKFHVTLVCDKIGLSGVHKRAFDHLKKTEALTHISWNVFLLRTKKVHEDFLNEAERQKRLVAIK
jgi:hypothetical protein